MKICVACGTEETRRWHPGPSCDKCYKKQWYKDNKAKTNLWRDKNPEKEKSRKLTINSRFGSAKNSAATRGKKWDISLEDFKYLITLPCYYCCNNMGATNNYGSGLDRVNNSIDYQLDNVVPCCKICNSMRNNYLTMAETKIAVQAILEYRKSKVAL